MYFAETGLFGEGEGREKREEVAMAEERDAEELVEDPQSNEQNEEKSDSPKGIKLFQIRGASGFDLEVEDTEEGEEGEEEEDGDKSKCGEIEGGI